MTLEQRLNVSLKAAVAAAVAWLAVQPLSGFADDYPFYAPLGAVIAVTSTVAGSVRGSLQTLAAILAGALVALGVTLLGLPVVADLALVVAVGSAVSWWRGFGDNASWAPISGMFVLVIGGGDAAEYAVAYLALTSLGVAIGIALNVVFPPLALSPMADSVNRLREMLAAQLDDLADGLGSSEVPSSDDWHRRRRDIRPTTEETQRVVGHATDNRRANWRAKRWDDHAESSYQQARALQQVAFLIEDITALVVDQERAELEVVALGPSLRPYAARALSALADVLRSVDGNTADREALHQADRAVTELAEAIRDARSRSASDLFAAGSLVTGSRRALASLVPEDLRDRIPADW